MAAIGFQSVSKLDFPYSPVGMRGRDDTPPGVSGQRIRYDGTRGEKFDAFSEHWLFGSSVSTILGQYRLLIGTVVTVTDDLGGLYPFMFIYDVRKRLVRPVSGSSPAGATAILEAVWTMRDISF